MSVDNAIRPPISVAMVQRRRPRPALLLAAGTLAAAAIGAVLLTRRRRATGHADSIEPRKMPGSAADIHVGSRIPVDPSRD